MTTFAEAGIEVDQILGRIVVGGNVLAERSGAKKRRRRVPYKQAKLVLLVAANGQVAMDQLTDEFAKEWAAIQKRRKGQPPIVRKREFFRNIRELVERINEALEASPLAAGCGAQSLSILADTSNYEVGWRWEPHVAEGSRLRRSAEELEEVEAKLHAVETDGRPQVQPGGPALHALEDEVTGSLAFDVEGRRVELLSESGLLAIDGRLVELGVHVDPRETLEELLSRLLPVVRELAKSAQKSKTVDRPIGR